MLKMDKHSQSELTEDKIRQFFEENFDYLRESAGHTISRNLKEQAFQQILCYWKKNKDIVEKMTRSEVKLSLPEQKTPNQSIPYTIEGVVDIVSEGNETWLYDLKTHPVERIKGQPELYKEQLSIYGYIWQNLQGNKLDNTAIISTPVPENLQRALRNNDESAITRLMAKWEPVIPFGYSEDEVADIIEKFGETVEKIENSEFEAPPVQILEEKTNGMKSSFGTHVCRNCDVRFSCNSFFEFIVNSRGANRNNMIEFMQLPDKEQNDFIDGNLQE